MEALEDKQIENFEVTKTCLPDGSSFIQINFSEPYTLIELLRLLNTLSMYRLPIRINFSDKEAASPLLNFFGSVGIIHGKTEFFIVPLDKLETLIADLEKFKRNFHCDELRESSSEYVDLMVNSFAVDPDQGSLDKERASGIHESIENGNFIGANMDTYLIRDSQNRLLAAFTLLELENEIQLHCVAGKPVNELASVKSKLGTIMYFALRESLRRGKPLAFNSSGAAFLYRQLGITPSDRYGVVILP